MNTTTLDSPATTGELTTIRFCGVNITLEDLDLEEFESLYDRVIDHGADLVEQAENWSASIWEQRKARHQAALDQNSLNLELLEKEDNRRKGLAATAAAAVPAVYSFPVAA